MKKVFFTAFAAMAFAFAMTACNNNQPAEAVEDTTAAVEQCEHKCAHENDSAMCCKAEGAAVEGEACEHKCEKACEHKCDKAEGKECCKKAEGKECEHKCQK